MNSQPFWFDGVVVFCCGQIFAAPMIAPKRQAWPARFDDIYVGGHRPSAAGICSTYQRYDQTRTTHNRRIILCDCSMTASVAVLALNWFRHILSVINQVRLSHLIERIVMIPPRSQSWE